MRTSVEFLCSLSRLLVNKSKDTCSTLQLRKCFERPLTADIAGYGEALVATFFGLLGILRLRKANIGDAY